MGLTRDGTSFRMKDDDEKVLRKESWKSNPVYCGDVPISGVPFVWESQPGTPKMGRHLFDQENIVPPLTPPPSYYTNINLNTSSKKNSKPKIFLQTLLTTINHNKSFRHPPTYRRRRFSSWGGETPLDHDDDRKKKLHGYNSSVYAVKKVFLAIFGL